MQIWFSVKCTDYRKFNYPKTVMCGFLSFIAFIVIMGLWITPALSAPKVKPKFPSVSLPERVRGEKAIQVLADKLSEVAAWYGSTPERFATMIRQDHTARIDADGRLLFIEEVPETIDGEEAPSVAAGSYSSDQTFKLHSLPGSKRTIYLDFDGHTTTDTAWNSYYGDQINSPAYDLDGDTSSFSDLEMGYIQVIWRLVSEDYAPFNVDVTTEDPGQGAITRSSPNDKRYGIRVVMTVDNFASCDCGGFAYVGIFDYIDDYYKPTFVFNTSLAAAAEAVSHEVGHNFGLSHDGVIGGTAYYLGHGSGNTGWASIMGIGYYKQLVQWSKGEYADADNIEDDIQIIQDSGAYLLADDHANNQANATMLDSTIYNNMVDLSGNGIIGSRVDVDFFSFISDGGDISINVNPEQLSPNLDILAELYDSSGTMVASSNPVDSLAASINETALPEGEYFIMVDGIGNGNPQETGYSDYASLGQYTINGSISNSLDATVPDIKASNLDGNIKIGSSDTLSINVSLATGSSLGIDCDWWVVVATPFGWYYFDIGTMKWIYAGGVYTNLSPMYQGPLFDLSNFGVLNISGLPGGVYTFYFIVDTNMNGLLDFDELFFDSVVVDITS